MTTNHKINEHLDKSEALLKKCKEYLKKANKDAKEIERKNRDLDW